MINNKKILGFFLLFLAVIMTILIFVFQRKKSMPPSIQSGSQLQINHSPLSPTQKEKSNNLPQSTKGQLFLEKENNLPIKPNQNFNLILKASISDEDIVGFDVVISYDNQALEFVSAISKQEEFTLVSVKKESHIRLTLAKKPSSIQPTFFSQTPVVRLTFQAKKNGLTSIEVLSKINNELTQFINNKTEIIYPETAKIEIDVL